MFGSRLRLFLKFLTGTRSYIATPSPGDRAGVRYHRIIVASGAVFGVLFGVAGFVGIVLDWELQRDGIQVAVLGPLAFLICGIILGISLSCACAPREFLSGPSGRKWMSLIGTQNLLVARAVCLALALIGGGLLFMIVREILQRTDPPNTDAAMLLRGPEGLRVRSYAHFGQASRVARETLKHCRHI